MGLDERRPQRGAGGLRVVEAVAFVLFGGVGVGGADEGDDKVLDGGEELDCVGWFGLLRFKRLRDYCVMVLWKG